MRSLKPVVIGRIPYRGHAFTMWIDITAVLPGYFVELKISPQIGDGVVEAEEDLHRYFRSSMFAYGSISTSSGERHFSSARKARSAATAFKAWIRKKTASSMPKQCGTGAECSDPMLAMSRRVGCAD
jgi:hypothetical protein